MYFYVFLSTMEKFSFYFLKNVTIKIDYTTFRGDIL